MIAVTMGDANGVGPEIALRAWQSKAIPEQWLLVGDSSVVDFCGKRLHSDVRLNRISSPDEVSPDHLVKDAMNVLDLGLLNASDIVPGSLSGKVGSAAYEYVRTATHLALSRVVEAVVTLPINKEAVRLSVPAFTGHTELIAEICRTSKYSMMLASDRFVVTHVSTHVPLAEAIRRVKSERVFDVIELTHRALQPITRSPRLAVAGLNPHAGEHGAFGSEDADEIAPAIARARDQGISVTGPEAPDTVFYRALNGAFDGVVCMYHDQGHIPMKLLGFDDSVNVTIGLPIVRTSVDHGTAYDIAYKGTAKSSSFLAAFAFARKLTGFPAGSTRQGTGN